MLVRSRPAFSMAGVGSIARSIAGRIFSMLLRAMSTRGTSRYPSCVPFSHCSATLMGIFGLVALVLSAVGVYGVTAFVISGQTHEIGIRMALGAPRGRVLGMLFRRGMLAASVGLAAGLIPAYGLARLMKAVVFGVSSVGPAVLMGIPLALAGAAALAIYIPARRAVRIDPIAALRNE